MLMTLGSAPKGVNVVFAHDTELALGSATALVNTARDDVGVEIELLPDVAALDEFLTTWQWTGARTHDERELAAVRALRPRLAALWTADEDRVVTIVNELLRDAHALPQLLKHDAWGYHLHATPLHSPLVDRMAVEAGMAMIDVIRMGELGRLRLCAADDCEKVLVDLSKNRSRRFCEGGCGNRANVAAYRARRTQAG
ncbi:CGNR zinc finger domain-containing protein [Acidothermaceae bacterium B102]|nr:CGNR zinc finger domain-containing protein [Acidothermaceae bacterium B102]